MKELPKESTLDDNHIADSGDRKIDIYKLIHLSESIPEETVNIRGLENAMDENCWQDKNGNQLFPRRILEEVAMVGGDLNWRAIIQRHPEWEDEIQKIESADYTDHPLIVIGENTVIDGAHRLAKALAEKAQNIRIKRFSETPQGAVIPK
jgi:hypothetical protein